MGHDLPPGFGVSRPALEAAALARRIETLCFEHRVNDPDHLPAPAWAEARAHQARIDALREAERQRLREHGRAFVDRARVGNRARYEARLARLRELLNALGGPAVVNKTALARTMGVSVSAVRAWIKTIEAERVNNSEPEHRRDDAAGDQDGLQSST